MPPQIFRTFFDDNFPIISTEISQQIPFNNHTIPLGIPKKSQREAEIHTKINGESGQVSGIN